MKKIFFGRKKKDSDQKHSWFGLHQPFDPKYRLVTSGLVQPWVLFTMRSLMALYGVVYHIVYLVMFLDRWPAERLYTHFTRLSFIGVTSYCCVAAFHSGFFVLSLRRLRKGEDVKIPWYPLQRWGRVLQFFHLYLFSTIITFPIIVTITYWAWLTKSSTWDGSFNIWANVSDHMLNTVFLLVELIFGRVRLHWGYFLPCYLILGLYLGLAYLVHEIQHLWVYTLLDPSKNNPAYFIVGVPVAQLVIYFVVWGLIHMRDWIWPRGRGIRVVEAVEEIKV